MASEQVGKRRPHADEQLKVERVEEQRARKADYDNQNRDARPEEAIDQWRLPPFARPLPQGSS